MLSAVLRSDRAVHMSIVIVRTFVRMRELMAANKDIAARVESGTLRGSRAALIAMMPRPAAQPVYPNGAGG